MEIKTKFDVNDDCWMMNSNKPECMNITGVYIDVSSNGTKVEYTIGNSTSETRYSEDVLFSTKEELVKSL